MSRLGAVARLVLCDMRAEARRTAIVLGVSALLFCLLITLFFFRTLQPNGDFQSLSFTDCLASLFGGMGEYNPRHDKNFKIPAAWLCVCLMGAYVTLGYPVRNLEGVGVKQCVAAQSRWAWWFAKCLWVVICAVAFCLVAFAVCLIASYASGGTASLVLSQFAPELLDFFVAGDSDALTSGEGMPLFIAGIPVALSALCLAQLAVSVNVNPLAAFAVTAAILFLSAFYLNDFALGNYLMIARSALVIHVGVDPAMGIGLSVLVGAAAVFVGGAAFARHDVLGKEALS